MKTRGHTGLEAAEERSDTEKGEGEGHLGKKSVSLVRSVWGSVSLSLLPFTFFRGRQTAGTTEELLEINGKTVPEKVRQLDLLSGRQREEQLGGGRL